MNRSVKKLLWTISFFLLLLTTRIGAQTYEHAVDYLNFINKKNEILTAKYMAYLSAVSHGKSARKVEKRRTEVVNSIGDTKFEIMAMPPWQGDKSFRDTTVAYLKILNTVFNEDYSKIVNMEEIAEQSYDAMEAYMLAQEKAYEKLNDASARQNEKEKEFAAKNNIQLLEGTSELGEKAKTANAVLSHCNEVYLVFFKPYKQEGYMIEAMNQKNLASMEQNINSLKKFAEDGFEKLKKIKAYGGDGSLINACRNMLNFYKSEAARSASLADFFLKEENFNKIKKQFDSKPSGKRTQQDIDQYNAAVNDINYALKNFNDTNNSLNKERTAALNGWNKTYNDYLDDHMPKQAKQ
ncbi:MAG: hypothetical protein HZB42_12250 [Sphingobacteriales bacterium]|nr:hypothetical protein [Sphingobacteriales bacterium]